MKKRFLIPLIILVLMFVYSITSKSIFQALRGERGDDVQRQVANPTQVSQDSDDESQAALELISDSSPGVVLATEYYDITGSTQEELRSQMKTLGPKADDGTQYGARTLSEISWVIDHQQKSDECVVHGLKFETKLTFLYPRWTPEEGVTDSLKSKWGRYIGALEVHENGHKAIELEQTHEMFTALNNLPSYKTCTELDEAAQSLANTMQEQYILREAQYDVETNHGETQGARF